MRTLLLLLVAACLGAAAPAASSLVPTPEQLSYRPHDETSGNPPRDPCDGWGFDDNGTCTVWAF